MFLIVDSDDKLVEKLLALCCLVLILGIRFIKYLFELQKNKQVNKYYTFKKLRVNNMFLANVSRNEKDQQINEYVCIFKTIFPIKALNKLNIIKQQNNLIK
jgi:hypothetical protein